MPHLAEESVDVDAGLTVTFVSNPGSESARWSPPAMGTAAVLDRINYELGVLDSRRRMLESARAAIVAQDVRRG